MTAAQITLKWECIANFVQADVFQAELTLVNCGTQDLPASGWALYFNTARRVLADGCDAAVRFEHVNGDLFRMLPQPGFAPLAPGATRAIGYRGAPWAISETDAPLGFFLVWHPDTPAAQAQPLGDPQIAPFARMAQRQRAQIDQTPSMTPARRFADNFALHALPPNEVGLLTPAPLSMARRAGRCVLDTSCAIAHGAGLDAEAAWLGAQLAQLAPGAAHTAVALQVGVVALPAEYVPADPACAREAYRLVIGAQRIDVVGASAHGVFNGLQSLRALLEHALDQAGADGVAALDCVEIVDAPRFAYRGMMLDVARHFSDKPTVLRLLDCMARYKLNKFHLHATDDEGWRIEIAALPELTAIGARRGFSADPHACLPPSFGSGAAIAGSSGTGYYSRADFVEILRYAHARHIEVIPELNLPGHARAAVRAMQARHERLLAAGHPRAARRYLLSDPLDCSHYESVQLWRDNVVCIGLPSCYRFIDTVVAALAALYREAGVPLTTVHMGGDEVPHGAWSGSPVCRALMARRGWHDTAQLRRHFVLRCRDILGAHGLTLAGWEEVALQHGVAHSLTHEPALDRPPQPDPALLGGQVLPYVWNNAWGAGQEDAGYRLANAGYRVVLANATNLYFDLAHAKEAQEPGYYWCGFVDTFDTWRFEPLDAGAAAPFDAMGAAPSARVLARMAALTPHGRSNIAGLQGQLWGENARDRARVEYLALPRMIALAERAWSRAPGWGDGIDPARRQTLVAEGWNEFANRLGQRELVRLDRGAQPYGFRIAPPGVRWRDGAWHANLSTPGLAMHYTLDGSEPGSDSPLYCGPVPAGPGSRFAIAAFTRSGRKSRTVTQTLNEET